MRVLPLLAAIGAGFALTACTYVERDRPAQPPVVLQQQPAPTTVMPMQAPPTVTVRPSY